MDNLQNRHSRPYDQYRRLVLPTVAKLIAFRPGAKFRWSQKAGCSCPCSPGFIVKDDWFHGKHRFDVHVSVTPAAVH